jgi:5-methylcytosine-specific restriction endonuclease McrA
VPHSCWRVSLDTRTVGSIPFGPLVLSGPMRERATIVQASEADEHLRAMRANGWEYVAQHARADGRIGFEWTERYRGSAYDEALWCWGCGDDLVLGEELESGGVRCWECGHENEPANRRVVIIPFDDEFVNVAPAFDHGFWRAKKSENRVVFSALACRAEIDLLAYRRAVAQCHETPGFVARLTFDSFAVEGTEWFGQQRDVWVIANQHWHTETLDATPAEVRFGTVTYERWLEAGRLRGEEVREANRRRAEEDSVIAAAERAEAERRRAAKLAWARSAVSEAGRAPSRLHIPVEIRHLVHARDEGVCVQCGSDFDLQFDHVIPVALGGSSTIENLQILCAPCNRRKGATLG